MTSPTHGQGVYCATAGAVFSERDALADHYSSDLHRYVAASNSSPGATSSDTHTQIRTTAGTILSGKSRGYHP